MDMNTLPITELRKLLTAVSDHGNKHLVAVESDLKQAAFLLDEAISKLGDGFMALEQQLSAQKTVLSNLKTMDGIDDLNREALASSQEEVHQQIQQVVTNLQFQDMTNQILERSLKRIDGLKSLIYEIGNHGDHADVGILIREQEEIAEYIDKLKQSLNDSDAINSGINNRAVDQKSMSSGSVDLF